MNMNKHWRVSRKSFLSVFLSEPMTMHKEFQRKDQNSYPELTGSDNRTFTVSKTKVEDEINRLLGQKILSLVSNAVVTTYVVYLLIFVAVFEQYDW